MRDAISANFSLDFIRKPRKKRDVGQESGAGGASTGIGAFPSRQVRVIEMSLRNAVLHSVNTLARWLIVLGCLPLLVSGVGAAGLNAAIVTNITNVVVADLRVTSVQVTWDTDEPATTEVEYGLTNGYGETAWADPRLTTTHSVHLSGLTPSTLYHFRVKSVGTTTAFSNDATFTTPAVPGGSTLYVGSTGFSATQGANQWTYRDSTGPMATLLTTGQVVTDFGTTWQGGEPFALLWGTGGHPGGARDAIRRWTAPADGTVQVSGVAHIYGPASTDGVRIQVKQGTTVLYERLFGTNDWSTDDWLLPAVPVTAGSTLDFVINRGGATNSSDATFFDPTIVFTPAAPPSGLSNVTASVLRVTSARISWNTDVAGTTEVEYGTTAAYGLTAPVDPTLVTSHSMYLGGLTPNTVYHYRVKSSNGATTVMSNNATFTTAAVLPAGSALYAASANFSTSQGVQQWSYRDGAGLLQPGPTSGPIFDVVGPYWVGSDPAVLLWNDGGHPGSATNAIRRWTAPLSGSVQISGVVYLDDINSVDGVRTEVWHNGLLLTARTIAAGDRSTSELTATVEVVQGDTIDFVINKNGAGNANDATYFNPAIVFTVPTVGGIGALTASQLRATSALITWQTAEPGTTEVEYGTTAGYGQTAWMDPRLTMTHSVHLSGLTPNTLYHYRVKSVGATTVQSTDQTFTTVGVPGGSTLYVGSTGFSATQGTNQWTYRDSSGPMATLLTTGQVVIDFGTTWQGAEPFVLLWATGGHPGGARDAIRRWTAPGDGTVQVSGVAHIYGPASTDGVRIQVKQGTTVLHERLFGTNDWSTDGWLLSAVPVTAGSTLDFVINRGGATNSSDATFFDPTIVFTPAAPPSGLSNVTASVLRVTSARITWNTDVPGTTEVEYGLTPAYGLTAPVDPTLVTSHSMYLGGLTPNTVYHYRVKSSNGATTVMSNNATFTTPVVLPAGSALYAASANFSTSQGVQQWSYRDGAGLLQPGPTSGPIFDVVGPYWVGSDPAVLLWNDGGHPGSATNAIRRWTAPASRERPDQRGGVSGRHQFSRWGTHGGLAQRAPADSADYRRGRPEHVGVDGNGGGRPRRHDRLRDQQERRGERQ